MLPNKAFKALQHYAVIVAIAAAIGTCDEMLNACFRRTEWRPTEEAQPALCEHQSIEWLRRHGGLLFK